MNTTLEEQLEYAKAMIEVLDPNLKLMKPEFRQAAARQLVYIAEQIAARYNVSDAVTEPEPEPEPSAYPPESEWPEKPAPPQGCEWVRQGVTGKYQSGDISLLKFNDSFVWQDASDMQGWKGTVVFRAEPAEHDHPVIDLAMKYRTRDGREVTELAYYEGMKWCHFGYVGTDRISWTETGSWSATGEPHRLDLIPTGETA